MPTVDFEPARDTYADSDNPNNNYGTAGHLTTGHNTADDAKYRFYIYWDLSDFYGVTVIEATFICDVYHMPDGSPNNYETYLNDDGIFVETTLTWNSGKPAYSTPFDTSSWSAAGEEKDWTSQVQDWLRGNVTNYGIQVQAENELGDNRLTIRSREYGTASLRPILRIHYQRPCAVCAMI